jgi:calcium channel MID1
VSYAVPLPEPEFPDLSYNATNLPSQPSSLLLEYLTNFTTVLGTFACGRDVYSPVQTCADCQVAYRKWLCSISFTRCGEQAPSPTPVISQNTGQQVFSALGPVVTSAADNRNPNLTDANILYTPLLPCLETCNAADRACPNFLGFACPIPKYNANMSYGTGYMDSGVLGVQGQGSTGVWQDRWGNVWCNGS